MAFAVDEGWIMTSDGEKNIFSNRASNRSFDCLPLHECRYEIKLPQCPWSKNIKQGYIWITYVASDKEAAKLIPYSQWLLILAKVTDASATDICEGIYDTLIWGIWTVLFILLYIFKSS